MKRLGALRRAGGCHRCPAPRLSAPSVPLRSGGDAPEPIGPQPPAMRGEPVLRRVANRASFRRLLLRTLEAERPAAVGTLRKELALALGTRERRPVLLAISAIAGFGMCWPRAACCRRLPHAVFIFLAARTAVALGMHAPDPRQTLGAKVILTTVVAGVVALYEMVALAALSAVLGLVSVAAAVELLVGSAYRRAVRWAVDVEDAAASGAPSATSTRRRAVGAGGPAAARVGTPKGKARLSVTRRSDGAHGKGPYRASGRAGMAKPKTTGGRGVGWTEPTAGTADATGGAKAAARAINRTGFAAGGTGANSTDAEVDGKWLWGWWDALLSRDGSMGTTDPVEHQTASAQQRASVPPPANLAAADTRVKGGLPPPSLMNETATLKFSLPPSSPPSPALPPVSATAVILATAAVQPPATRITVGEMRRLMWLALSSSLLVSCLSVGAAVRLADAVFVTILASVQQILRTVTALWFVLLRQSRRAQQVYAPAAASWFHDVPASVDELKIRAAYQANVWGLQLEQALTNTWAQYLTHRRNWMRGQRTPGLRPPPSASRTAGGGLGAGARVPGAGGRGLPAAARGRGLSGAGGSKRSPAAQPPADGGLTGALQDWWDARVVATNRWWVGWQLDRARDRRELERRMVQKRIAERRAATASAESLGNPVAGRGGHQDAQASGGRVAGTGGGADAAAAAKAAQAAQEPALDPAAGGFASLWPFSAWGSAGLRQSDGAAAADHVVRTPAMDVDQSHSGAASNKPGASAAGSRRAKGVVGGGRGNSSSTRAGTRRPGTNTSGDHASTEAQNVERRGPRFRLWRGQGVGQEQTQGGARAELGPDSGRKASGGSDATTQPPESGTHGRDASGENNAGDDDPLRKSDHGGYA